jgi:hypothetical protein
MSFVPRSLFALAGCAAVLVLAACPPQGKGDGPDTTQRDTLSSAIAKAAEHDSVPRDQPLQAADTATVARSTDTTIANARPAVLRIATLDPLADSISDRMVFLALTQTTYIAAMRGKRLLMDLGRFDGTIAGAKQKRAFEAAAAVLSPVHPGDRFLLRGTWGPDTLTAAVRGFTVWNGRIVALLALPPFIDSLAKTDTRMVALATKIVPDSLKSDSARADSLKADSAMRAVKVVAPGRVDTLKRSDSLAGQDSLIASALGCQRDSVGEALAIRVAELADSLAYVLEADTAKLTDRLKKTLKTQKSQAVGCFGKWRVILLVNQSAGDYEYVHQLGLVIDADGVALPLGVRDLRFKAHEVIRAFDADGDGVDDLAVKGRGNRIGGTVILKFVPERRRLEYVMGGFAWEVF